MMGRKYGNAHGTISKLTGLLKKRIFKKKKKRMIRQSTYYSMQLRFQVNSLSAYSMSISRSLFVGQSFKLIKMPT
jgi:hypothetical protein